MATIHFPRPDLSNATPAFISDGMIKTLSPDGEKDTWVHTLEDACSAGCLRSRRSSGETSEGEQSDLAMQDPSSIPAARINHSLPISTHSQNNIRLPHGDIWARLLVGTLATSAGPIHPHEERATHIPSIDHVPRPLSMCYPCVHEVVHHFPTLLHLGQEHEGAPERLRDHGRVLPDHDGHAGYRVVPVHSHVQYRSPATSS
ncbi:hypothetical protein BDR22DRAFT_959280 [Usnea florida]